MEILQVSPPRLRQSQRWFSPRFLDSTYSSMLNLSGSIMTYDMYNPVACRTSHRYVYNKHILPACPSASACTLCMSQRATLWLVPKRSCCNLMSLTAENLDKVAIFYIKIRLIYYLLFQWYWSIPVASGCLHSYRFFQWFLDQSSSNCMLRIYRHCTCAIPMRTS